MIWVVPALGTVTAANGIGHLAGSLAARSYSPGTVSGVGVWAPLDLYAVPGVGGGPRCARDGPADGRQARLCSQGRCACRSSQECVVPSVAPVTCILVRQLLRKI